MDCFLDKKDDVLRMLNTSENTGLTEKEIHESREKYGKNSFTKEKPISIFVRIWKGVTEPMLLMLVFAGVIATAVNIVHYTQGGQTDFIECVGIAVAICLSVAITVIMEGKSAKAFEALSAINEDISVRILRNGKFEIIPQNEVVVGDIVFIETGNKLPADGRLLESIGLNVDESALTGESMTVEKNAEIIIENPKTTVAERFNMVYSGCFVSSGNGKMVATSVGDGTEFGKIAHELSKTDTGSTPLQEKLGALGKKIAIVGISISAIVFFIQLFGFIKDGNVNFTNVSEAFISSIILIVASIPEGLPTIVAISLSINIMKMSKQNALVKKMVACETIGSVNVVCSDKTGTFTENRMTVTNIYSNGTTLKPNEVKDNSIIENFAMNSTADVNLENNTIKFLGNPTECALLVALDKSSYDYKTIRKELTIEHAYPFSSETKNMTTIINANDRITAYTKGSPEKIFLMCNINEKTRKDIENKIEEYQEKAQRVIAFAHKDINNIKNIDLKNDRESIESEMIYDGFVAITDPIREEVYGAVEQFRTAGIDIKMLTGDNIITATAIAKELGMIDENHIAVEATDIEHMSDSELTANLKKIRVIARSTPIVKMRVVNNLKSTGHVVAVTGDGINDAPAIKNADVGIAMGITGTEVSKEASDIVLLDDSFATIVRAVQWGRGIYENFQRFIQFQLTVNVASVSLVFLSIVLGFASPFTALQLLWINIIMDGPPALALGVEPIRDDLMKRLPTKRNASIVTKSMITTIATTAIVMIIIFFIQRYLNILGTTTEAEMTTALFTLFVMFQLFNSFNSRELGTKSMFKHFFKNKMVLLSILVAFILQIFVTQFGGSLFKTVPLSFNMWIKIILLAFCVIIFSELFKLIEKLFFKNNKTQLL